MKKYDQLNEADRDILSARHHEGKSIRWIAKELRRSPSTILRELKRNRGRNGYFPHHAQELAEKAKRETHHPKRLKSYFLQQDVEELIMKGWSPEIIAGRYKRQENRPRVSHETIYKWIYKDAQHLIQYLSRGHKQRMPRHHSRKHKMMHIPSRVSIAERPIEVELRKDPGHWESDLVVGPGTSALQVVSERKSRLTLLAKLEEKTADESSQALIRLLSSLPSKVRKSVTYDNGTENVKHEKVNEALGMRSYFCHPYHSWEKGMVENTNGLIRRFFPKGMDLSTITVKQLKTVQDWLNNRPRKCLGFQTPAEVLKPYGVALAP